MERPPLKEHAALHESLPASSFTCYGYSVQARDGFTTLRPGTGCSPLEIVVGEAEDPDPADLMLEWTLDTGDVFARVWSHGRAHSVWVDRAGLFRVDVDRPSIIMPTTCAGIRREVRLWGVPASLCFMARGDLALHAAAIDVGGRALILAAPGHHGKTTLAGAFVQAGHRLLSEDLTCCRASPQPAVWPGPAMLRLRRDVFPHLVLPRTSVAAEDPDRIYVTIDESERGDGAPVPVAAIVLLRESDGGVTVETVAPHAAVPDLWGLSFHLPTDAARRQCFQQVTDLAAGVQVWNLRRFLSYGSLPAVVDRILSTCLS